jgi:hypothetical protein
MTAAGSQAAAFYRDVARTGVAWTIRDDGGYPAPKTADGRRSMPFWSSLKRAQRIVATVPAYAGFRPVEVSWVELRDEWLPQLVGAGSLVGVNWSGARALGFDTEPSALRRSVEALMRAPARRTSRSRRTSRHRSGGASRS